MPQDIDTRVDNTVNNRGVDRNWSSIRRFLIFSLVATVLFAFLGWFYFKVLTPIFIAGFLAYLISPAVDALERKKINRHLATLFLVVATLGGLAFFFVRVGPVFYEQLTDLVHKAPSLLDSMVRNVMSNVREMLKESGLSNTASIDRALGRFSVLEEALSRLQLAFSGIWATGAGIMGTLLNAILIPFIMFFMVAEKPRLFRFGRRLVPRDVLPYIHKVTAALDDTLKAVVRGHIKVASALAILYAFGFWAIGVTAGVAIGLVAGICRVIPYLDVAVATVLGVTYIFSEGLPPTKVFALLGVIGVVQILDGAIITPNLIGSKVGLHPAVVILSILAFGYHLGFWGVLLAIPMAATIKALYNLALPVYRASHWFKNH